MNFIFHQNLHHTIVEMTFEGINRHFTRWNIYVIHPENYLQGIIDVAATEFYLVIKYGVRLAHIGQHTACFKLHFRRAIVFTAIIEGACVDQTNAVAAECYLGKLIASGYRWH